MKIIICQIAIVVLLIVQLNNAAQAQLSRIILPQDSITFKKINIAFVNLKTHINNELPDTSKIDFNIKLNDDTLGIEILKKGTNQFINSLYHTGDFRNYKLHHSSLQTNKNRFFICPGLTITRSDSITRELWISSILYAFKINSDYSIENFGTINGFNQLLNESFAAGSSYYYSGGGHSASYTVYGNYTLSDTKIEETGSYSILNGDLLCFKDSIYNTLGHLFYWRHPDVGIMYLELVSTSWELLYTMTWELPELVPYLHANYSKPITINGKNNYLLTPAGPIKSGKSDKCLLIIDLEKSMAISLLKTSTTFGYVWHDTNGTFYFKHYDSTDIYIIDHMTNYSEQFQLTDTMLANDTLGRVCNANIFGNNMRFYSESDLCNVDSTTGIITLKLNYADIISNDNTISCIVSDGFDIDTVTISIQKPVSVRSEALNFRIFPNPCSNFLTIDINSNFSNSQVSIIDLTGKILIKKPISSRLTMDIDNLENGLYIVRIESEGLSSVQKILIVK